MRHFLQLPPSIVGLPRRVPLPTPQRFLVTPPRFAHAFTATYRSALVAAELLSSVAAHA